MSQTIATYPTLKSAGKGCTATRYRLTFEKERLFFIVKEIFSFEQRETNETLRSQMRETIVWDNYIYLNIQVMFNAHIHGVLFFLFFYFAYYFTLYIGNFSFGFITMSVLLPRRSS